MDNYSIPLATGLSAEPVDFPYQVQILHDGNFLCMGTVLTTYLILAAAHCFKMENSACKHYTDIKVRRTEGSPEIALARPPIIHGRWGANYESREYDIAMVELSDHLADVSPAILTKKKIYSPTGDVNDWMGSNVTVSGWGVSKGHNQTGIGLNFANLTIRDRRECGYDGILSMVRDPWGDYKTQTFCTRSDGVDACEGDSGGPATCRFTYDFDDGIRTKNIVCGILSTKFDVLGCFRFYTDVTQYTNWIVQESCLIRTNRSSSPLFENFFVCCNLFVIAKESECDGFEDCLDGSDESNCFLKKAHKRCIPTEELCAKPKVTFTVLAPTFVYPNSQYQLDIFLERVPTKHRYTFRAWFINEYISDPVTIGSGDQGTILIPTLFRDWGSYTLVVEAVDTLDDSASYLRHVIPVGGNGRTILFTDKDVYVIGEYVHLTAIFLDPLKIYVTHNVSISVRDSRDNVIWKYYRDHFPPYPSLISHRFPIAPHGNHGNWTVHLTIFERDFLPIKRFRTFLVTDSQLLGISTNRSSMMPTKAKTPDIANSTFSPNTSQYFPQRTECPLKIRLLDNLTNHISQDYPLKIQGKTFDAVDVANLAIYSEGEVVFAKSYQPVHPTNFSIQLDCPEKMRNEAKLVVFGYIRDKLVSDALDLKVVNGTRKTNDDLGLSLSVDTIEVDQEITIYIKAKPGSSVYLHAEDAAFEDPDEFTTKKWLNQVRRPSRTPKFSSNLWENLTEVRLLEFEVMTNAPPQNPSEPQMTFDDEAQKVTNPNRTVWLSQVITITDTNTYMTFKAPSTQGEWRIKGFAVIQEHKNRRLELLPVALLKTFAIIQLPQSVNQNDTLVIPIFINNFMSENTSAPALFTVRSNGSINFGENGESEVGILQRPENETISIKMTFNQVGKLPIILDEIVNGTVTKTIKKLLNVRPNWRNITVTSNLARFSSSDLMEMLTDNVDNFASTYGSGSAESNLLLMTANVALLKYWNEASGKDDVWKKRFESLQIAYQNQLALKRSDGSFAKFANSSSSSIWLTAWTIQAFVAAEEFIYIDENVIKGGLSFLKTNVIDMPSFGKRKNAGNETEELELTAFTLVTLIVASRHCNCSKSIQRAQEYLQRNFMAASLYGKTLAAYSEHVLEEMNPWMESNVTEYLAALNYGQNDNVSLQYQELSPALKVEFHSYTSLMSYLGYAGLRTYFHADILFEYFEFPSGFLSAHGTSVAISTLARIAKMKLNFSNQVKIYYKSYYICSGAVLAPYLILINRWCYDTIQMNRTNQYKNIGVVANDNRIRVSLKQSPIYNGNDLALLELEEDLKHVQSVILSSTAVFDQDGSINTAEGLNEFVTRQTYAASCSGNLLRTENLILRDRTTCFGRWDYQRNAFCLRSTDSCIREEYKVTGVTSCFINYINTKSLQPTKAVKKVLCGLSYEAGNYSDIAGNTEWIIQKSHQIRYERGKNCSADEFQCRNQFCIPKSSECDGYPDCLDASDERKCSFWPTSSVYNKTFCAWVKSAQGDINAPTSEEVCFRFIPISVGTLTYDMVLKTNDIQDIEISKRQQILMETAHRSFVYTNKNVYFSDEIIQFGAVFLDIPDSDSVISIDIRILDSSDHIVWQDEKRSLSEIEKGFLSYELPVSSGNSGTWKIIMRRQEIRTRTEPVDTTFEKKFKVQKNPRPKFRVFAGVATGSALYEYGNSPVFGRYELKLRVMDDSGNLAKEFTSVSTTNSTSFDKIVSDTTPGFFNGKVFEIEVTVTESNTGQAVTEFLWGIFPGGIREINSHRVRRPGLPYHAEFKTITNETAYGIQKWDEELQKTPNIEHTPMLDGHFTIEIPPSALSTDAYFQFNYSVDNSEIFASFAQNVPRIDSNAKHFLQIRLVGPEHAIYSNGLLQVNVMTTDVVDVLHMIIHSDGEIISYHSYSTNNTKEYVIETRCPKVITREATIVVFTEIKTTFVSDAVRFIVINRNNNTFTNFRFYTNSERVMSGENITVTIQAPPNSFVYLHVEDAVTEDSDEFASKTWLIESLLQLSRTNKSEQKSVRTDFPQLDLSVLSKLNILHGRSYDLTDVRKNVPKRATSSQRILVSKIIEITNGYKTINITVPFFGLFQWRIKGYGVVRESRKFRRIEILPTKDVIYGEWPDDLPLMNL